MTPVGTPRWKDLAPLLETISLELALATPGTSAGAADTAGLMSELLERISASGRPDLVSLSEGVSPMVIDLRSSAAGWHDRHISAFSAFLTKLESALHDAPSAQDNPRIKEPSVGLLETATQEDEPILIDDKVDHEFLREFCNEGRDLLQNIESGVLVLEQSPAHRETLNSIFRAFHTFKGGAGFLGLTPVKRLAHELESLLDAIRQGKLPANRDSIDLILAGGDCLGKFVDAITRELDVLSGKPIFIPTEWLLNRVTARLSGDGSALGSLDTAPAVSARFVPPVAQQLAVVAKAPSRGIETPAPTSILQAPQASAEVPHGGADIGEANASIRIGLEKLDTLVDLVAELVIAQSMVIENPSLDKDGNDELSRGILVLQRITKELQHNAMSLRMVPVRGAFQKMQRLVRDLAGKQGKVIHLKSSGEETEIDRNIVAQLQDPLIHMVRNACDHGIETPEERIASGKPSHGTINLSAFHQGGGIIIQIADDGRGLDPEKLRRKAIDRGVIPADAELSREDAFQLIFEPGFSTAEAITDLSGRGVGMDVVRGNISRLRGRIEINSVVGAGTTFTIYLPLTLAIIQGMIICVGGERFIIPTLAVREFFRPEPDMISPVLGRGRVINRRGRLLPVLHLGNYLGISSDYSDPSECMAIIAESGTLQCCLLVDRLLGKNEVVIKDLGEVFEAQGAMSGAAILGDGQAALIIDVDHVVSNASSFARRSAQAHWQAKPASPLMA